MIYLERNGIAWQIPDYHGIAERYRTRIYLPWDNWQVKKTLPKSYGKGRFGELRKGQDVNA